MVSWSKKFKEVVKRAKLLMDALAYESPAILGADPRHMISPSTKQDWVTIGAKKTLGKASNTELPTFAELIPANEAAGTRPFITAGPIENVSTK